MNFVRLSLSVLFGLCILGFYACADEEIFATNPDLPLTFSVDTLRFDTVFTTLGSATRTLKIYNKNDTGVNIERISLNKGSASRFRLNIDGISTNDATDVRILANDSLYVFAEVTIDPDQPLTSSPFVFDELLDVTLENNTQSVVLEAWGQNANYLPSKFSAGTLNLLSCDLDTVRWDDPKPYVIYGALFVDSCNLVLPAGTQVYVHGGIGNQDGVLYNDGIIIFQESGSLITRGTAAEPVIIQGDRLESNFDNVSGQWSGIRLSAGSTGNSLRHTTIKNSITGIQVDSVASLVLDKCQIYNTAASGVVGYHANITANNTLIHSNGGNSFAAVFGGNYTFRYCTLANFGNQSDALRLFNFTCEDALCLGRVFVNRLNANFFNCVITGSNDEIIMEDATFGDDPNAFNYNFSNCVVSVEDLLDNEQFQNFLDECNSCIDVDFRDQIFQDADNDNYRLDSMSVALDLALPLSQITDDIDDQIRDVTTPDPGCYELEL